MDLITFGLLLVATLLIIANLLVLYWFGGMLIPVFAGGGPYVPTRPEIVEQMLKVANITPKDIVVDLGSGDGRLVIAAINAGARRSMGYEIHPGLTKLSNRKIRHAGFVDRAIVLNHSMWKANLTDATVVFLYQIPYAMGRIRKLLESQLAPGSRIVSHAFKIPGWEPEATEGNVVLYVMK